MSSTTNKSNADGDKKIADVINVDSDDDDDDDDSIDEEQLEEYREMIKDLGSFPDKVTINSLSMVAEDHAESKKNASAIYECIRQPLISKTVSSDRKLPLVYVIDSILKNVKGKFIRIIEQDAKKWMPVVYYMLADDKQRQGKLKKVWNIWKDVGVFVESNWKEIGQCFLSEEPSSSSGGGGGGSGTGGGGTTTGGGQGNSNTSSTTGPLHLHNKLDAAGIVRAKDGSLVLNPALRNEMQRILDELQSDTEDELEKVSLERLASIDPDLLTKIKQTAEEALRSSGPTGTRGDSGGGLSHHHHHHHDSLQKKDDEQTDPIMSFIMETRTQQTIDRSKAWAKLELNHLKETHDIISKLQHLVRDGSSSETTYTQSEAIEMSGALATAAATASILTNALQQLQIQNDENNKKNNSKNNNGSGSSFFGSDLMGRGSSPGYLAVDKSLFTNDGIKKLNQVVVGFLYEVGLPFVSSSDGRRFATQLELSNHLDALFKKGQLEKSMARTEERGWYVVDAIWTGEATKEDLAKSGSGGGGANNAETSSMDADGGPDEEADPSTFTVPADESRDRCVICGINFKMLFDNDDGIYKYNNCREIKVLNDDAAERESEQLLVHVTCWRGLGSPPVLSMDQALQDAIHY